MFYVTTLTTNSTGTITRNFQPYENEDTALRKFYEVFNTIGAGSTKICALLSNDNLEQLKREIWEQSTEEE